MNRRPPPAALSLPSPLPALAAALALVAACGARTTGAQCRADAQCGGGNACVGGSCIPSVSPPGDWGVEIVPSADSAAALTEFSGVNFGAGALQLAANPKTNVTATFATDGSTPSAAHVIVTVPAAILGRPDLRFESDLGLPTVDPGSVPQFSVAVPQETLSRMATIQINPTAPADQSYAPFTFHMPLGSVHELALPSQSYTVTGRFFDAVGGPRSDFRARAFRGSELVSSVHVTGTDGAFAIGIPIPTVAADPLLPISVMLTAQSPDAIEARYTTRLFTLSHSFDLGTLNEAAFLPPNVFRFTVRGGGNDGPAMEGAIVRAFTVLLGDPALGTTDFLRDARTAAGGSADVSLLPGNATEPRSYSIVVVPPADSPYGVLCLSDFAVGTGGTADAPASVQTIVLPRRPALNGRVTAADGSPVPGVVVVATRSTVDDGTFCSSAAGSPPVSTTTGANGDFTLLLDPGTYQIDYDPPADSPSPRLTQPAVTLDGAAASVAWPVQLDPGALVQGDVLGPDGTTALAAAAVRLYELPCHSQDGCPDQAVSPPLLRAQARTDALGHFRAVIPFVP